MNYDKHWGWFREKKIKLEKVKVNRWLFVLHSLGFNVSLWFSRFLGGLLLCKLGPRLPSGHDQNWEARTPSSQCLGHQQEPNINSFHHCFPEQSRGDAIGSQGPGSTGRWCYYYYLPPTLESKQVLLCSREAAAPHHSCRSAFRQKRKKEHLCSEVPISARKQ